MVLTPKVSAATGKFKLLQPSNFVINTTQREKIVKIIGITPHERVGLPERGGGGYVANPSTQAASRTFRMSEIGRSSSPRCSMKTPLDSLAETLLSEGLPPPNTRRWVVRRKAAVVAAVNSGKITLEQACQVYQLSEEEFLSWQHAFETHGFAGLRTTRIQQYRWRPSARAPLRRR
jgi:Protein of unknown function (DUF1153)